MISYKEEWEKMQYIMITNREKAEDFLLVKRPSALVSITNPGDSPCEGFEKFTGAKIHLDFGDVLCDHPDAATKEEIKSLLAWAWVENERQPMEDVLIHCNAGISRSPAVGIGIQSLCDTHAIPVFDSITTALNGCTEFGVTPNMHIISLMDELLFHDGELIENVKELVSANDGSKTY